MNVIKECPKCHWQSPIHVDLKYNLKETDCPIIPTMVYELELCNLCINKENYLKSLGT